MCNVKAGFAHLTLIFILEYLFFCNAFLFTILQDVHVLSVDCGYIGGI